MKNGNKLIMLNFLNKKDNMYIRRKVFSLVEDQENNYEMEERLYSTGDEELDELLERAFCEGYEAAQREFASVIEIEPGKFKNGEFAGHLDQKGYEEIFGKESKAKKAKVVGSSSTGYNNDSRNKKMRKENLNTGDEVLHHTIDRNGGSATSSKLKYTNKQQLAKYSAKEKMRRINDWVKAHPGKAAAIVAGTAAVGTGAAIAAKKAKKD